MKRLTIVFRPELFAFTSTSFFYVASADNHGNIILDDHLPKMIYGCWQWPLTSYNFLVKNRRIYVTSIYILGAWLPCIILPNTSHQLHSSLFISNYVNISVSLRSTIHNHLLLDCGEIVSVEESFKHFVFGIALSFVVYAFTDGFFIFHEFAVLLRFNDVVGHVEIGGVLVGMWPINIYLLKFDIL